MKKWFNTWDTNTWVKVLASVSQLNIDQTCIHEKFVWK